MPVSKYFNALNYSLANEDTSLEYHILKDLNAKKILSVCGSGSRSLPLISEQTQELICVDLSLEQLMLAKLREQTFKQLNHQNFLLFWGYPPYASQQNREIRKQIFDKLDLDATHQNYFLNLFESQGWSSILYNGKWERTFQFFSKIVKTLIGRQSIKQLFEAKDIKDQLFFLEKKFPKYRWEILMAILGNKSMFNALLYKGNFIKKNVPESYLKYYSKAFDHLMRYDLARKSFFMQLCFYGEIIFAEGNLFEAVAETFHRVQKSLAKCKIRYVQNDIINSIKDERDIDFLSISDVPSYFYNDVERNFLTEIRPSLSPNGVIVMRNYLRIPEANRRGYVDISSKYQDAIDAEKVQMYHIEVLKNEQ